MAVTYRHSGAFGDLIYSLIVPYHKPGNFEVVINGVLNAVIKYTGTPNIMPIHKDYFTPDQFYFLVPLLERQSYLNSIAPIVNVNGGNYDNVIDLDNFRSIIGTQYNTSFIKAYYQLNNIPFTEDDWNINWIEADPERIAPIIVSRSDRYRSPDPFFTNHYRTMDESMHFTKDAVFIGSPDEHELFQRETGIVITFVKVKDMLDMANIIAGADAFVGNQGLSLALATGLGKTCVVEKRPTQYLDQCETYWKRDNMFYF